MTDPSESTRLLKQCGAVDVAGVRQQKLESDLTLKPCVPSAPDRSTRPHAGQLQECQMAPLFRRHTSRGRAGRGSALDAPVVSGDPLEVMQPTNACLFWGILRLGIGQGPVDRIAVGD